MPQWIMIVDLRKCIGCATCTHVCSYGNETPPGSSWRTLTDKTLNDESGVERLFVTLACMHCEEPPCRGVCPTKATYRLDEGFVLIKEDVCIGCGACVTACPYNSRSIADREVGDRKESSLHFIPPKDRIGICTKCDFCFERISTALNSGQNPGNVKEATPYCSWYCPSDAISFGNAQDAESDVSNLLSESRFVVLAEDLGTKPSVYYIVE